MIITEDKFLRLSDNWRLRVEGGHAILYSYDPEVLVWYPLSKEMATGLLLMDGKKTLAEIKQILQFLFDDVPEEFIKELLESLMTLSSNEQNPNHIVEYADTAFSKTHRYNLETVLNKMQNFTQEEYDRVESGLLLSPLNLTIMPTNKCFTDCIYCYSQRKEATPEEMLSLDRWFEIIDEASELGVELAVLTGGDPMAYPNILPLLEKMLSKGFLFVIPSKSFISKDLAKKMADIGMKNAWNQVSIDAVSDATAEKMVGVKNYAKLAFESIQNMIEAGLNVRVNCVMTPINCSDAVELVQKLDKLGVRKISIAGYGRSYYRHNDDLFLTDEQMEQINTAVETIKNELTAEISCNLSRRDYTNASVEQRTEEWKERAKCSGGRSSMVITPTGKVTLCEQMPCEEEYFAGDLSHQSILDVWNSERIKFLMAPPVEMFKGTACEKCEDFEKCMNYYGYCFRDALFTYNTVYSPPPTCPKAPQGIRLQ